MVNQEAKVAVVVPFYKNEIQLAKCKDALKQQDYRFFDTIIVDDSDTSNGFTATAYKGLLDAIHEGFKYAVLLNQDCYLAPDALGKMVAFMESHECAIAGIKQLMATDPDKIIHGGTGQCFPTGIHHTGLVSKGDCNKDKQVPWVNGACMIFRVKDLIITGILDENMKMFGSDSDISYRARAAGKECWYIASASCLHEWGASKSMNPEMGKIFQMDMLYFRDKWLSGEVFKDLNLEYFGE